MHMKSDKFFNKVYIIMATIMSFLTFTFLIAMGGDKIRGDLRDASIVSVVVGFITGAMLASVIDSMKNTECEAYLKTHSFIERAREEKVPSGIYAVNLSGCVERFNVLNLRMVDFDAEKVSPIGPVFDVSFKSIPSIVKAHLDGSALSAIFIEVRWSGSECAVTRYRNRHGADMDCRNLFTT